MLKVIISILLVIALTQSTSISADVSLAVNTVGFRRVWDITWVPPVDPNAFSVVGISGYKTGVVNGSGSGAVNAAVFAMQTPALSSGQQFGFYFGYLHADASWSINSNTGVGSISGSLAELAASVFGVWVYEDRDGIPGLNYQLGVAVFDCNNNSTYDCIRVDTGFTLEFTALDWLPIQYDPINCTSLLSLADQAAGEKCTVGIWNATTSDGSITITLKLATHPILVGTQLIDPDSSKIDILLNYNWTGKDCDNCKLALIGGTAGKIASGSFAVNRSSDGTATTATFSVGNYSTYFRWESSATIAARSSNVYFSTVTNAQLSTFSCTLLDGCNPLSYTNVINLLWKGALAAWAAFGWDGTILLFSWVDVRPDTVYWDPAVGGQDSNRVTTSPTSSSSSGSNSATSSGSNSATTSDSSLGFVLSFFAMLLMLIQ